MKKRLARKKKMESVSKHGRKTFKSEPTVHKDPAFDDLDDAMDYMETEDAHDEGTVKDSEEKRVSTEDQVSTAQPQPKVSTDKPKVSIDKLNESIVEPNKGTVEPKYGNSDESATPTTVFRDDETIAQFLVDRNVLASSLVVVRGPDIGDCGLGLMVVARLNADEILAEKLQEEEREKFTIEQRAKLLHDTIAVQRRFLAQQRSEAIRNKFPSRNQLRNQMMTYLKHVGGYKHAQLNKKKFEEIQTLYERQKKFDQSFIPIDSAEDERQIREMNKKTAETDTSKKRKSGSKVKRIFKRRKTDSDVEEKEKLKSFLNVEPDEDKAINYEVLQTRFPIVEWESKFYDYGHYGRELIYYRVIRADGSSRWIKTFSEMVKLFDRMDLVEIHSLVMKRFATTTPEGSLRSRLQSWRTCEEGKLKENQGCRVDTGQVHQNGDFKNRSVWIHPPGLQDAYTEET
ncbi:hypothetical protein Tco_1014050 [Tanacetum coccineum]